MYPQSRLSAVGASLILLCALPAVAARRPAPRSSRTHLASRGALHALRIAAGGAGASAKSIVVSKSAKTLTLMEGGVAVRTYPIAVGRSMDGAKQTAGDWRTPEGVYTVAGRQPASRFYLALKISYPNVEDAERGLRAGIITPAQADAIRRAEEAGALPPQNTALGRDIEIHGGYRSDGSGIKGYTRGCMALTNQMIREIYRWAPDGTVVIIRE
ncbi:MAG TPA: L,D-transpeptidase [Armatimonadota bacterium]|jgi:murein L,D-transpeptidase YafK